MRESKAGTFQRKKERKKEKRKSSGTFLIYIWLKIRRTMALYMSFNRQAPYGSLAFGNRGVVGRTEQARMHCPDNPVSHLVRQSAAIGVHQPHRHLIASDRHVHL